MVSAAKLVDPAVVELIVSGQHLKGQILVSGELDVEGEYDTQEVGIEQEHHF